MLNNLTMLLMHSSYFPSVFQGWSMSDVMFVTKRNMMNAVATVTKQLENVHETLAVSCIC